MRKLRHRQIANLLKVIYNSWNVAGIETNLGFSDIEVDAYNTSYSMIPARCTEQFLWACNEVCIVDFLASKYLGCYIVRNLSTFI